MSDTRMSPAGNEWREVDLFLRVHGHLPDEHCGGTWAFGACQYTEDRQPINADNDFLECLRKKPEYVAKEKAVLAAQKKWMMEHEHHSQKSLPSFVKKLMR